MGANRLWGLFGDPAEQVLHPDWEEITEEAVAVFRESVGTDTDDPRFVELVGGLSLASPRFSRLWVRHDIRVCEGAPMRLIHPRAGDLRLNREKLDIGGTEGQVLEVLHPDPGTDSADKLALLASAVRTPADGVSPGPGPSGGGVRWRAPGERR